MIKVPPRRTGVFDSSTELPQARAHPATREERDFPSKLTQAVVFLPRYPCQTQKSGPIFPVNMEFNYEIPADEYAAANVLYYKASHKGTQIGRVLRWIFSGLVFILVAVFRSAEFGQILLILAGAFFIYVGVLIFSQASRYRRAYPQSGLAGKTYRAEMDEQGFTVSGNLCRWQVPWNEARLKGEDKLVFMFSGKGTIFIFGKKFLSEEQQAWIRRFVGGSPSQN